MREWQEDNFLERLTHSSPIRVGLGMCPEAEAFHAPPQGKGSNAATGQLGLHMMSCPRCSDLHRRLDLFDQHAELEIDSEVVEAEKRLDSWLRGLLSSRVLGPQTASVLTVAKLRTAPLSFRPKRSLFSRIQWGLAAAVILVIAFGLGYIRRSVIALPPSPLVTQATAGEQLSVSSNSPTLPDSTPIEKSSPKSIKPKVPRGPAPPNSNSAVKVATLTPSSESRELPDQQIVTGAQTEPLATDQTSAVAEHSQSSALTFRPNPILPPAQVSLPTGTQPSAHGEGSAKDCQDCQKVSKPNVLAVTPSLVRVEAGTRIWIVLESATAQSDRRIPFEGRLLLPVSASDSVILEKGTRVMGVSSNVQGQLSVQIGELVLHGNRYKLRESPGLSAIYRTGTGRAVQFAGGKTVEMWLDSATVFEAMGTSGAIPPN
jgi:hypothetical protein